MEFFFSIPVEKRKTIRKRKDIQILGSCQKWNVKVTVIPLVIGALGTIPKKDRKGDWNRCKSEEESRPSQNY